jgi:hypothetical protein
MNNEKQVKDGMVVGAETWQFSPRSLSDERAIKSE